MENRQNFQRDNNNRPPRRDDRGPRRDRRDRNEEPPEFEEKLVSVNRVTKTVKGGRNMRFSALIVIGDKKGRVGVGMGKAVEIPEAIRKAVESAKRQMIEVPTKGTTIPHEVIGKLGKGQDLMMPAQEGTGFLAGGHARAVLELAQARSMRVLDAGVTRYTREH